MKLNVNTDMMTKNAKIVELNSNIVSVIDRLIQYKYLCCNKNYQKKFNENSKKRFASTYKCINHDINKCNLLLRKGVYPYQRMYEI